jgi:hypothetical protein
MFAIARHETIADALSVRAWGVWDVPTALAFERALASAVATLTCAPGNHLVLSDVREFQVQSEEIVLCCRAMFDRGEDGGGVALVVGAGACRAQIPQVVGEHAVGVFEDVAAGEAWLLERGARLSRRAA